MYDTGRTCHTSLCSLPRCNAVYTLYMLTYVYCEMLHDVFLVIVLACVITCILPISMERCGSSPVAYPHNMNT